MSAKSQTVQCPVCNANVIEVEINQHLDSNCRTGMTSSLTKSSPIPIKQLSMKRKDNSKPPVYTQGKQIITESSSHLSESHGDIPEKSSPSERPVKRQKLNATNSVAAPLAERLRPADLSEFVGQEHLTGPHSLLMHLLQGEEGAAGSMILWGPSGCGKTTLARILAKRTNAVFKELSASSSGINDVRSVFEEAKGLLTLTGRKTILFLDEIHRFNKSQQDIFLPYVEQGHIQLVGATTENPSFKLNSALISRCRVFVLERLTDENILQILERAVETISCSGKRNSYGLSSPQRSQSSATGESSIQFPQLTEKVKNVVVSLSHGDARIALSLLELVLSSPADSTEKSLLGNLRHTVSTSYDRTGDPHYDMISALHKSVRGSNGSAALYWLGRMLTAGEDPLYIARRLIVMASEDIGLGNNHALPLATATLIACQNIGMPECRINLAHCVAYLAESTKSTRSYEAYNDAEAAAKSDPTVPVPLHLRNAPTGLMKDLGYGREYLYNPAYAHPVHQEYLPPQFFGQEFLRKEGNLVSKVWDESLLKSWERECNHDQPWERRGEGQPQ